MADNEATTVYTAEVVRYDDPVIITERVAVSWDGVLGVDISLALADGRFDEADVLIHDASALAIPNSGPAWMFEVQAELLAHLRGASDDSASIPPSPLTDLPWGGGPSECPESRLGDSQFVAGVANSALCQRVAQAVADHSCARIRR